MASTVELRRIVELLGPEVGRVVGSLDRAVARTAPLAEADATAIAFCKLEGADALAALRASRAGAVLCREDPALDEVAAATGKTLAVVERPRLAFLRVVRAFFMEPPPPPGIHPSAIVDPGARVDPSASVGPFTTIGAGCEVGARTVISARVSLYPRTRVGANVWIDSGAVIGADGFGFERNERGELEKFPHTGGVVIEDDVEIGANATIDRGTLGDTLIRRGAKLDNLVHIAHNATIGRHTLVIAQAMVAGSCTIGDQAWIAPCAAIKESTSVGDGSMVGLGAVVISDVPPGVLAAGLPARAVKALDRPPG